MAEDEEDDDQQAIADEIEKERARKKAEHDRLNAIYEKRRAAFEAEARAKQEANQKTAEAKQKTTQTEQRTAEQEAQYHHKLQKEKERLEKEELEKEKSGRSTYQKGKDWFNEHYDSDREKREAEALAKGAKALGKAGIGVAKAGGKAGAAVGMTGLAVGKAITPGTITIFFYTALFLHILDAVFGKFGTSGGRAGINGFRFGIYVFLWLFAWFAFYGRGQGDLNTMGKPAAISALAFFLPILASILFRVLDNAAAQQQITQFLVFIPIWPVIIAFGIAPPENKHMMVWRIIFIGTWLVFALPQLYKAGLAAFNIKGAAIPVYDSIMNFLRTLWQNIVVIAAGVAKVPGIVSGGITGTIQHATGDYYTGQVDDNQEEPIGVYLEDIQTASNRFFERDAVVIWGVIRARTMDPDKEIKILTSCYAHTDDIDPGDIDKYITYDKGELLQRPSKNVDVSEGSADVSVAGVSAGVDIDMPSIKDHIVIGDANPRVSGSNTDEMTVTVMEEKDVTCEFPEGTLKKDSWTAYLSSTFNFDTYSYLKAYFMDEGRMRAIRRQDQDPLDFYGITDKMPVAVYTNGPVMVGMEITQPLTGLNYDSSNDFRLGITLENRWQGRIKEIRELTIKIPPSMSIEFCDYNIQPEPCRSGEGLSDECEDGKYEIVYRLQDGPSSGKQGKSSSRLKNIDTFQSFNCKVNIDSYEGALGDVPVNTQYFKVSADYLYELKAGIPVFVEESTI